MRRMSATHCMAFKGCSSEHAEVRSILKVLTPQIAKCSEPLNAQAVGNALYGLQGCSSEHAEVRSVLDALTPQIAKCSEPLSAQAVGNALYGLQKLQQRARGSAIRP